MVRRPPGIELALLGFLRQEAQHAYQIHLMLSHSDGLAPIWKLKQSQLYALLAKLEKDGYIKADVEQQESARPPRRLLHLTRSGHKAFENWVRAPVYVPRLIRQEFMAKYFFALLESSEHAKALVEAQKRVCLDWLNTIKAEKPGEKPFQNALLQYRIGQTTAALNWLEQL